MFEPAISKRQAVNMDLFNLMVVLMTLCLGLSCAYKTKEEFLQTDAEPNGEIEGIEVIFDDSPGMGLVFEGIGAISGGGATSKLLVNYPKQQRDEVLDFLFKPNFGASLHIFKVEIGGDTQSTDGTEASHMHNSWEENYHRGYEWWLLKEAVKRNPHIKLAALPWGFPGWLGRSGNGTNTNDPYGNPTATADYVVRWINAAKEIHNLTIDNVGIWNEKKYNATYIKTLRKMLDLKGFQSTKIVAADELMSWKISKDVLADEELAKSIYAIGSHYTGTVTTHSTLKTGKPIWASEDFDTINNATGAGCWARILNQNYVNGFMTSTTAWNLVASYYAHLPYLRTGLMTAMEPWSGHYSVAAPIWVTAHTTQFVSNGWKYLAHGNGVGKLPKGGSYVSLTNEAKDHLTIVIETMTHDHSECIRPHLPPYEVSPQTVTLTLKGGFAKILKLNVWHSKLKFDGSENEMFEKEDTLIFKNGKANLTIGLDEIFTLTTVASGQKGSYPKPPESKPFPTTHSDDFEGYDEFQEPYYLTPQMGSYEVLEQSGNKFARQTILQRPVHWCKAETADKTMSIIGNYSWANMGIEVDFRIPSVNGTNAVFVAARVNTGGCHADKAKGIFLFIFPDSQNFILTNDLARAKVILKGQTPVLKPGWNKVYFVVTAKLAGFSFNDDPKVFETSVPQEPETGWLALGTDSFGLADFDNLSISIV